jgi:hypothetical protein
MKGAAAMPTGRVQKAEALATTVVDRILDRLVSQYPE